MTSTIIEIQATTFRKIEYFEKEAFDLPILCDFQDANRRLFYVTLTVTHTLTAGSCSYAYVPYRNEYSD